MMNKIGKILLIVMLIIMASPIIFGLSLGGTILGFMASPILVLLLPVICFIVLIVVLLKKKGE